MCCERRGLVLLLQVEPDADADDAADASARRRLPYRVSCSYLWLQLQRLQSAGPTGVCENKFLLGEPLPCNPEVETALQPVIRHSKGLYLRD